MPLAPTPFHSTAEVQSSDDCDYCDDGADYGPHRHDLYETREGASHRTADELVDVFLDAVEELAAPWRRSEGVPRDVSGWLLHPDLAQALSDEVSVAENVLSNAGYYVRWEDGYVIEKIVETPATSETSSPPPPHEEFPPLDQEPIFDREHDPGAANDPPDPTAEELREIADQLDWYVDGPIVTNTGQQVVAVRLRAIADRIDAQR